MIERVFLDSRYDDTQSHATLRGVYFTSATQAGTEVVAERLTIAQRLARALLTPLTTRASKHVGNDSYFLHELLTKIVFTEAHLVRPNLRWEFRFRLLRLIGHALALLIFAWLAIGLRVSFGTNSEYLDAVARKTQALAAKVTQLDPSSGPECSVTVSRSCSICRVSNRRSPRIMPTAMRPGISVASESAGRASAFARSSSFTIATS